jgi:ATP-dependent helicase HepA
MLMNSGLDHTKAPRAGATAPARTATRMPGQRVINEAELGLGLGSVMKVVDQRTVQIFFGASDEVRVYNIRTAPLKRMRLRPGQTARLRDGRRFKVEKITRTREGILYYAGDGVKAAETDLDDVIPAAEAVDRLQTGQFSPVGDYDLRVDGWRLRQSFLDTEARGLVGARVRPLGHQLYIAHKIARQEVPRVLLSDEVGLGKTIEAGLIFSALRALGRAHRVLIVTPPSLVHQWMAEMYRKFNEMFSVLSEERCEELDESLDGGPSPFEASPRAIVGIDVLLKTKLRLKQAAAAQWDLLIVDEAHHFKWSSDDPKSAKGYAAIEMLAARAGGLLLLTATPARDGLQTEFGLLRLVDPERFSDFEQFEREREQMKRIADVAARVADGDEGAGRQLLALLPADQGLRAAVESGNRARVLRELIDRHGTGRVLVRNRRDRLHGFPERVLHGIPLQGEWHDSDDDLTGCDALPPDARPSDPRVDWLLDTVRAFEGEKIVLICASERLVHMLARVFRERSALKVAVFHEGLSTVERDRQAAWFAEPEGATILLCSEIGGEGRNFQFSHHLVLFDLPIHPDLVEQRIGRLDRIGQDHPIHIHVPYLEGTPHEALFRWHRDALLSFERPVSGAEEVMIDMRWQLGEMLAAWRPAAKEYKRRETLLAGFTAETARTLEHVRRTIEESVDFLVDLNSYDEEEGARLVEEVRRIDADHRLRDWVSRVFDRFGVVDEQIDVMGRERIRAGEMMFVDAFPGLPNDEMGATWRRTLALAREDLQFLSSDHPLVDGALGIMLDGDEGRAAVAAWPEAPMNAVILQCLFVLDPSGPADLELHRYVPITAIEVMIDVKGRTVEASIGALRKAGPDVTEKLQPLFEGRVPLLLEEAQGRASAVARPIVEEGLRTARAMLGEQQQRLVELRRVNPTLPEAEVERHARRVARTLRAISDAEVHLDAVRVIVAES